MKYRLAQTNRDTQKIESVFFDLGNGDGGSIPFDPANTDYQQFKVDVADGVPLEDPDGNVMTQEQVDQFLKELP